MFETVCYKKSYLAEVVARVDFVTPVGALEKNISAGILNKVRAHFPIAEPAESIGAQIQIAPDGVKQTETRGKHWNFFGKNREKQLSIQATAIYVSYTKYSTFEALKEEFHAAISAVVQEIPGIVAKRFGLRYINKFSLDDLTLSNTSRFFSEALLGSQPFSDYMANITRKFHIIELKFEDLDVRFQYGFPNEDYPAIIKRPVFVIDIDAYSSMIHSLGESLDYIESAHGHIQNLFEGSITNELREKMNG
jgi:uncharacterized protein (TIGR04255 family)